MLKKIYLELVQIKTELQIIRRNQDSTKRTAIREPYQRRVPLVPNCAVVCGAEKYIDQLTGGKANLIHDSILAGIQIHFYGDGVGKSTLCQALRRAGAQNISEAGELNSLAGCWGIPEGFSGVLIAFRNKKIPADAPTLEELPSRLWSWI